MPAIIKQQFFDPQEKTRRTKDIHIDVDFVRLEESDQIGSAIQLKVDPVNPPHNVPIVNFTPITIQPTESLSILLDGCRTKNLYNCFRTRLAEPSTGTTFTIERPDLLKINQGDPVVIMDALTETTERGISKRFYGIVKSIRNKEMSIYETDVQPPSFFKGAVVQNLSNRWHPDYKITGAKSQLKQPAFIGFRAYFSQNKSYIMVVVNPPLMFGTTKCYDIYIRNHQFNSIEYHWIPDAKDIPATSDDIQYSIETYNGGIHAGGNLIENSQNETLYCVVITKDGEGFYDVQESICSPQKIENNTDLLSDV